MVATEDKTEYWMNRETTERCDWYRIARVALAASQGSSNLEMNCSGYVDMGCYDCDGMNSYCTGYEVFNKKGDYGSEDTN